VVKKGRIKLLPAVIICTVHGRLAISIW